MGAQPLAIHPMAQVTIPASAARYLQAVASGSTKAQGLKRPTLAGLQQAAEALALPVQINYLGSGYYVAHDGYGDRCGNLADAARFLLLLQERREAQAQALQALSRGPLLPGEPEPAPRPARSLAPLAADLGRSLGLSNGGRLPAPRPFAARVADDALAALTDLGAEPAPGPSLPAFVTYGQQQQQPQQGRGWAGPYRTITQTLCDGETVTLACEPRQTVAPGPKARKTAPARLPADAVQLLARFGLSLDGLLTEGLSNAKLAKGAALAWPVILHHLPARSLAQAVAGAEPGPTAPRSRLPGLHALAEREDVLSLALAHNGCPWASAGCAAGCLAWAGHGGMSATVAAARARRSLAFLADSAAYGRALLWAIARAWARAQAKGLPLAVRLRGTDDLSWHLQRVTVSPAEAQALARRYGLPVAPGQGQTLAEALCLAPAGSLHLYDYSKAPTSGPLGLQAQRAAGWDVTASLAADRPGGAAQALQAISAGFRLAVPVALPKGAALPSVLWLAASASPEDLPARLLCIDGDATDHRWADPAGPQPGGFDGVAVILRTKRSRGKGPEADAFSLAPAFGSWQPLAGGGQALLGA
jgi:hypothetical protein